ncbi:TPA: hypothetical protein U1106_002083, partial [Streptococcus suis]|nr:hypothetical protein [Streptococcus suis]
ALFHKHGIDVSENDFWATSLNGRTPQDILNEKAKLLYIKFNLLEKEARKYGFNKEKLDFKKVDWKLVSDRYIELKQIVIDEKIKTVNHDQIKQYYLENNLNFARQDLINGKISTWNDGLIISTESVEINEETVRLVTERFPDLELQLENIEVGQQFSWKQNGIYYTFSCLSREDKGIIPLSEITDAVAMQCAEELVDNWLNKET